MEGITMKEFMGKLNIWKAWSIRIKAGFVFTLVLIIFVISGVFHTPPTPSPRFSVPYNIEEDIQHGSEYYLLVQNISGESKPNYMQALLPASIAKSENYKLVALDIAFDKNFDILPSYKAQDIYDKVIQLDKALYVQLSAHNHKNHKIDEFILEIDKEGLYLAMLYKDGCQIGVEYDYIRGVYSDVSSINGTVSHDKEQEIRTYLNKNLDKKS